MRTLLFGRTFPALLAVLCGAGPAAAWDRGQTAHVRGPPELAGQHACRRRRADRRSGRHGLHADLRRQQQRPGRRPAALVLVQTGRRASLNVALVNPAPAPAPQPSTTLLGLVFQASSKTLLICDLAQGIVWQADPKTGRSGVFMNTGLGAASGLNGLTFDKAGNVYVSDSFQGVIWKTGPAGGTPVKFVDAQTLSPEAASGVILVPPFGANGVEFNNEYTEMYVANTAYHSIVEIPVAPNGDGSVSVAGSAAVLTTGINAPDGIAVDRHDNLWVVANQEDEIDVIGPNALERFGRAAGEGHRQARRFRRIEPQRHGSGPPVPGETRRSALTARRSTSRTCHCTCLMPACRSRRSKPEPISP